MTTDLHARVVELEAQLAEATKANALAIEHARQNASDAKAWRQHVAAPKAAAVEAADAAATTKGRLAESFDAAATRVAKKMKRGVR